MKYHCLYVTMRTTRLATQLNSFFFLFVSNQLRVHSLPGLVPTFD